MIARLHRFFIVFLFAAIALTATAGGPYTIPVVIHVIHDNGPENIPDIRITQTLGQINDHFGTADTVGIAWPFIHIVANMQIGFCLAHTDPSGHATTGIDRIADTLTYHGENPAVKLNQWPQNKYLNIWIVDTMAYGIVAYAASPATAYSYPAQDGIVLSYHLFDTGSEGDRIITRMIGTWLNLENTWGNGNSPGVVCGDDNVYDTPVTRGSLGTCDTSRSTCTPGVVENVQNYMDLSTCPRMFTSGQRDRVWACLDTTIAGRNNLSTPANLVATCAAPTSVNDIVEDNITVSPNPFSDMVAITGLGNVEQSVAVYDITGRIVYTETILHSAALDLKGLSAGAYLLILSDGVLRHSFKMLKQK